MGQVNVGPNVHVSKAHAGYTISEVLLSADPVDPSRLLGCGIVYADTPESRQWTVAYLSTDGGKSWEPTLETKSFQNSSDPACVLGRNGLAYHLTIVVDNELNALGLYRSSDGGRTWAQHEDMPMQFQGIDRESLTVDATGGRFRNRVYISGATRVKDLGGAEKNGFAVWRSRDVGVTFEGPVKRASIPNHYIMEPGNSVVLSDGTLVSIFGDLKNSNGYVVPRSTSEESNAVLEAITSTDGGDSISEAVRVDDFFMVWPPSLTMGTPTLAVDSGQGPFRDRLYATWADERYGRSAIRFSYSTDKAKTWSKAIVIDDVSDDNDRPENFLPTIAVNKAGIALVTWYDRRDNPDGLGWYLRARASLDGGETWLPSVRVSEKPSTFSSQQKIVTFAFVGRPEASAPNNMGENAAKLTHVGVRFQVRQFFAGDYAGLAADASGTFHAFWIDNRTGLPQIWTAPIVVDGRAIRNGDAGNADLKDVSRDVELEIVSTNYDRASNTVTVGVRLKNSSKRVIQGPVKLRLINITSALGSASPANADNQLTRPGAVWDLSSSLNDNVLKPDQTSAVRQLVFRVDNPRELLDGKGVRVGLIDFDVCVLAEGAGRTSSP